MAFRDIFEDGTWKLLQWVAALLVAGIGFSLANELLVPLLPANWQSAASSIGDELAIAFICAAILVFTVDVGLRKELLEDIQNVFRASTTPNFIERTVYSRQDLNQLIAGDVASAKPGETISTIGITEGTFFTNFPGMETLQQKIASGSHLRVLLLHPESKLLDCIQNESRHYGTSNVSMSISKAVHGIISILITSLQARHHSLRGSLEIRLHKDLFSSGYYYSSDSLSVFSPYLAHKRGTLCPAFVTRDRSYQAELRDHFSTLWRQSEGLILAKVDRETFINHIPTYGRA